MYTREKTYIDKGEENLIKSRKNHKNMPSFSSVLLDEIYRSIDGNAEDLKSHKDKKQSGCKDKASIEDVEIASFRRACLVEKWMEKEISEKVSARRRRQPSLLQEIETKSSFPDNDLVFFSSTSSSSDSSGQLSSSDTEFFGPVRKPKVSCFSTRPKPVRTRETNRQEKEDPFCFKNGTEEDLIKSKSRALKIYASLKKVKQPISPGVRLTSFINSILNNGKKSKNLETNKKGFQDLSSSSPKALSSTCSSASSFSRSCLSKYPPESREKMRNGVQRTVRFNPVSVIVDEDSRPCGHKSIYDEDSLFVNKYGRPPLPPNALKSSSREENRNLEHDRGQMKDEVSKFRKIWDEDDNEDEDAMSDTSSDLFELDHLTLFGNNRFCEELPLYETTHLDTNRAIASGLIR